MNACPGVERIGPYGLIRELGRGRGSVVWLAERVDGARAMLPVALKLPATRMTDPAAIARFRCRRDRVVRFAHPHVAHVRDAGITDDGQPFVAFEHVAGLALVEACNARVLDLDSRLRLFLDALSAVTQARRHGIVPRHITSSKVLVDEHGRVKLLDLGLADLLDEPGHAPSEVRDFGLLLCELLTNGVPASRTDPQAPSLAAFTDDDALQRAVISADRLRARLSGDLDAIVLHALRSAPAESYASLDALADDLRRHLANRPIAARPSSWLHRARLCARRHRKAAAASALGLVIVAAAGSFSSARQPDADRHDTLTSRQPITTGESAN